MLIVEHLVRLKADETAFLEDDTDGFQAELAQQSVLLVQLG